MNLAWVIASDAPPSGEEKGSILHEVRLYYSFVRAM
jgi:hypothetical protein